MAMELGGPFTRVVGGMTASNADGKWMMAMEVGGGWDGGNVGGWSL